MTTIYDRVEGEVELTPTATGGTEPTVTTDMPDTTIQFRFNMQAPVDSFLLKRLGGAGAVSNIAITQSTAHLLDKNRLYSGTSDIAITDTTRLRRDINILEPDDADITIGQYGKISGAINIDHYFTLQGDIRALGGIETTSTPVISRAQPWWDHDYMYRRKLEFTTYPTGLPEDHPVTAYIPRNIYYQGKVRQDYEDLEVVYLETVVPENWIIVGRNVIEEEYKLKIETYLPVDIDGNTLDVSRLFVYYGNPRLTDAISRPSYTLDEWPLTATYESKYVTYTREWVDGVSDTPREKAVFVFYGPHARVKCMVGPEEGIVEFQVDNDPWVSVDLYDHVTASEQIVFTTEELDAGRHQLRVRVTGQKNPTSTSTRVRIREFNYRNHSTWVDIKEEHDETLLWGGSMVGV